MVQTHTPPAENIRGGRRIHVAKYSSLRAGVSL